MSQVKQTSLKEPCQKSVPIFPVRYSVKPRENKEDVLKTDFPILKHSEYVLRLVRRGYIYLYDHEKKGKGLHLWEVKEDGMFQKIVAKQGSIASISKSVYDKENKYYRLEERSTPYILARAKAKEVYVGFSDALWTSDIFTKIMADTDNIRTNIMTKVDVDTWDKNSPAKGTFSMGGNIENDKESYSNEFLEEFVEEYKEDRWTKNFEWSPYQTQKPMSQAKALKSIMDAYPTSNVKSIGVMLYDNIGLVVDQGGIVDLHRKSLEEYLQKDDSTHKKIVSDCIESIYKLEVSKDINGKDVEAYISKTKDNVRKANDSVYYNTVNPLRQADYFDIKRVFTPKESYESVESKIFENHAKDRMRTVDEKGRLKFLETYEDGYKILAKKLMESKNDRWIHLCSYINPKVPVHLGSSFLNYDTSNKVAADLHGQAFSFCITDMMSDPYNVEYIINKEHDLFADWMELPKGDDPLLNALVWAYDNKPDTMMGAIDALAKLPFSEMETINSTLEDNTKSKIDELNVQQQHEYVKLDELEQERSLLEKTIDDELNKLHSKYSNVEISKNIATYILSKPKRLNGAALTMANRKFNEFIYSSQRNKIDSLVNNILSTKRSYNKPINKGDKTTNIEKIYLSPEEYQSKLSEAANLTTHETQRFHFEDAQSTTPAQDTVKVLAKDKKFVFSVVNNTNILDTQLNIRNMGQAVQGASKGIDDIASRIEELAQQSKQVENVFHKEYNPFVTKLNRGLSPLVILANAINLSRAMDSFESDNPIEVANLTAAITGSVAALLYGIDSFRTKSSSVQIVADMRVEQVASNRFFKYLTLDLGMKVFGTIAASSDVGTQYLKGKKAEKEDNNEARNAYYLSAFLLGVGGGLTLLSSPILIVVGVVSLIGGMFALSRADDLVWDEIDKWLNACVWRKKGEEARNIPSHKAYGTEWDKEYIGFISAFYVPKVDLVWNKNRTVVNNSGYPIRESITVIGTEEIKVNILLPFINSSITWGYIRSSNEKELADCRSTLYSHSNKFSIVIDNKRNSIGYEPLNFSMMWSLPFKTGSSYSVVSHYQFKVGGEIKRLSLELTKQWNVSKTIGGKYGTRF